MSPSPFFYANNWQAQVVHFHACLSVQRERNENQHNVDHNLKSQRDRLRVGHLKYCSLS